jgi:hypothetical protein
VESDCTRLSQNEGRCKQMQTDEREEEHDVQVEGGVLCEWMEGYRLLSKTPEHDAKLQRANPIRANKMHFNVPGRRGGLVLC